MGRAIKTFEPRECLFCRQSFQPKREWQKYCSQQHRLKHWAIMNPRRKMPDEEHDPFDVYDEWYQNAFRDQHNHR